MNTTLPSYVYGNYLEDKSVAVIGGDDQIDWNEVDKCDVVIRINSHVARQGGKCDVLYFSCAHDLDYSMLESEVFLRSIRFVMLNKTHTIFGQHEAEKFTDIVARFLSNGVIVNSYYCAPHNAYDITEVLKNKKDWAYEFAKKYSFHPLTGLFAVADTLRYKIKSLYITGMNLYAVNSIMPRVAGRHDLRRQILFLLDCAKDKRIKFSSVLQKVLDNYSKNQQK